MHPCMCLCAENVHRVTKVDEGERLAITIAFSCDKSAGIPDPDGKRAVLASESDPDGKRAVLASESAAKAMS